MIRARWTRNEARMAVELRVADHERGRVLTTTGWVPLSEGEEIMPLLSLTDEHGGMEVLEAARAALPDPAWQARYEEQQRSLDLAERRVDAMFGVALRHAETGLQ